MRQGDRVSTSRGKGTVAYVRMAPPTFSEVDAVSVVLDSKRGQLGYTGTILDSSQVIPDTEGDEPARYRPEAAVLYDGTPGSGSSIFYRGKQSRGSIHD